MIAVESQIKFDLKNVFIVAGVVLAAVVGIAYLSTRPINESEVIEEDVLVFDEFEEEGGVTDLETEDLVEGTGELAVSGKSVTVHYTGTLTDGTKFDSSLDRDTPFTFNLGAGEVIKGWDQGVTGMKVGGKRKLTIPPELGYGDAGSGASIPPNSTLIFEVELLNVE